MGFPPPSGCWDLLEKLPGSGGGWERGHQVAKLVRKHSRERRAHESFYSYFQATVEMYEENYYMFL